MSTTVLRPRAVIRVEKTKILLLLAYGRRVYNAMLAQALRFPNPVPAMPAFNTQLNSLDTTQQSMGIGGKAATAARNAARDVLWSSLGSLRSCVQVVADNTTEDAVEVIKSASFDVAIAPSHTKPELEAELTSTPGSAKLIANASILLNGSKRHATFNWQSSIDGGHTWVPGLATPVANVIITGLPLMTNVQFRVSVTLDGEMQPWSQIVTLLVH